MKNLLNNKDLKVCIFSSFVIGLIAHGYCCFNGFFNNDSLNLLHTDIKYHGLGIGRVLRPIYGMITGAYTLPVLMVISSLIFIAIAAYLIVKTFDVKNNANKIIICGLMTTNITITLINASCIQDISCYMFSMLLCVMGVYLIRKYKLWYVTLLGLLCFSVSLALYQPMVQCAIMLLMICLFFDIISSKSNKSSIIKCFLYIAFIIFALVLYSVIVASELTKIEVGLVTTYNGITQVGNYDSIENVIASIIATYYNFYYYFIEKFILSGFFHEIIIGVSNIFVLMVVFAFIIIEFIVNKANFLKILITTILVLLMPFGLNFVCFLSQGLEHELMIYSFVFIYVFAICLIESLVYKTKIYKLGNLGANLSLLLKPFNNVFIIIGILIVFNSVVFSNQSYLCKQLQLNSTNQIINRVVDELEHKTDYIPGETPVAFIGDLGYNKFLFDDNDFDTDWFGMRGKSAISFYSCYTNYFKYYLNYPVNMVDVKTAEQLSQTDEFYHMFVYPSKFDYPVNNYIYKINDVYVVKLSWDWSEDFFA